MRGDLPPIRYPLHKQLSTAEDVTTNPTLNPVLTPTEEISRSNSKSPISFVANHFSRILSRPPSGESRLSTGSSGSGTIFYTGNQQGESAGWGVVSVGINPSDERPGDCRDRQDGHYPDIGHDPDSRHGTPSRLELVTECVTSCVFGCPIYVPVNSAALSPTNRPI